MPKTIEQSVVMPALPEKLFEMYMDPALHGEIIGGEVEISPEPGSGFSAFDGSLMGKTLHVVPGRMIVQTWRADHWTDDDVDSILVLTFWPEGDGGRVELVQVNVADHDFDSVSEGWHEYYWKPWKEYLTGLH